MRIVSDNELNQIERSFGFTYPKSFRAGVKELVTLCGGPAFQRHFPNAKLLVSAPEIVAERESMDHRESLGVAGVPLPAEIVARAGKASRTLVPFLRDEGRQSPDTYAFDLESPGPEYAVVVWSYADPMVVRQWDGFAAFFQWLRERVTSDERRTGDLEL
jgi:hypothetical protein